MRSPFFNNVTQEYSAAWKAGKINLARGADQSPK
jgi:hypothetical protein